MKASKSNIGASLIQPLEVSVTPLGGLAKARGPTEKGRPHRCGRPSILEELEA
jgi:hypothetical protein